MFQFPSFALTQRQCRAFNPTGCPIRISPDLYLFAVPRSFSQLTTSFFASESLGIHLTLFIFLIPQKNCSPLKLFYFTFRPLPFCTYCSSASLAAAVSLLRRPYKTFLFTSLSIPNTSMNFFSAFLFTSAILLFLSSRLCFPLSLFRATASFRSVKSWSYLSKINERHQAIKSIFAIQCYSPKRRCSSHTFRYGYLVTT